jgi:hypothetical protein
MILHVLGQILFFVVLTAGAVFAGYLRIKQYADPTPDLETQGAMEAKAYREAAKAHAAAMSQTPPETAARQVTRTDD